MEEDICAENNFDFLHIRSGARLPHADTPDFLAHHYTAALWLGVDGVFAMAKNWKIQVSKFLIRRTKALGEAMWISLAVVCAGAAAAQPKAGLIFQPDNITGWCR